MNNSSFALDLVTNKHEAQLSQRDHMTHRVIEYFAKLLKVIRNDTVEQDVRKSLLTNLTADFKDSHDYSMLNISETVHTDLVSMEY